MRAGTPPGDEQEDREDDRGADDEPLGQWGEDERVRVGDIREGCRRPERLALRAGRGGQRVERYESDKRCDDGRGDAAIDGPLPNGSDKLAADDRHEREDAVIVIPDARRQRDRKKGKMDATPAAERGLTPREQ